MSNKEKIWIANLFLVVSAAWAYVAYAVADRYGWRVAIALAVLSVWAIAMLKLILSDAIASVQRRRARRADDAQGNEEP
jgi:hypothetical protein